MPIRIYALAKELKIDSKALVDVCTKAGVTGKGSALASLSDDEASKVKSYLAGGGKKSGSSTRPSPLPKPGLDRPITRDDYIGPGGSDGSERNLEVIKVKSEPKTAPPPLSADKEDVAAEKEATKEPGDIKAPEVKPAEEKQEIAARQKAEPSASKSSEKIDPLAPVRPKPVDPPPQKPKPKPKGPPKPRGPVVKFAAIPKTPDPAAKGDKSSGEPAPQKPIMTLPRDAIRGAREGSTAPLEQFTRQQDKKDKKTGKATPPGDSTESTDARGRKAKERRPSKDEIIEKKERSGLANMASARQQNRQRRSGGRPTGPRYRRSRMVRKGTNTAAPRKGKIVVETPCTIRSFSESTGIPVTDILRFLMGMGSMTANINAELDIEMAEMLAEDAGVEVDIREAASLEDTVVSAMEDLEDDPGSLVPRPPIVTFLGHVDHGKTSLLDRVLGLDVVSGEAGGITQHIRAYEIEKDGRKISFVDTPGHEAFTEMRARGANVTDIAVLVVAADDGVMPQTEEAISHARAAEVPIIVALNKIDLPNADENKAMQDLATHELLPTEWGGEIELIKTSAITGDGIDDLLETILLTADIHEYAANPKRPAIGTCLEAQQEGSRGIVAKVIVMNGTLRVGDVVVCGAAHGRVKAMHDTLHGKNLKEAGPSVPANIMGLDVAPEAGDRFYVLDDISNAREIAEHREHRSRTQALSGFSTRISFEEFQRRLEDGVLGESDEVVVLNLIIRADVRGSIEAIQKELTKLDHPEVQVKVLQASVGGVTVADVTLADASNAVIVGFNVIPDENARSLADERGVEIRRYDIIYKLTEDIKLMLEGKLKPEEHVKDLGRALVQRVFTISRVGSVAGCRVLAGTIERGCRVRVNRDGRGIGDYPLDTLKREKDDAKEVREGYECGVKLAGFNDIKEGDILEAYKIEEVARTL